MKTQTTRQTVEVRADGEGLVSHAGAYLLVELADRLGLTAALAEAMAPTRERRSAHNPGVVVRDLAVSVADGGECVTDLGALRGQEELFGPVASETTAHRAIKSIDAARLEAIRGARAKALERAWDAGARPETITLDIDASLLTAHSEKQGAAGTYEKGALNPSTQRCLQGICRGLKSEGLPRPGVQLGGDRVELRLRELR